MIWGPRMTPDPLTNFFIHALDQRGLVDIEPSKLNPTWRNHRSGKERIPKRLDQFVVAEGLASIWS